MRKDQTAVEGRADKSRGPEVVGCSVLRVVLETRAPEPSVGLALVAGRYGSEGMVWESLTHALKCGDNERGVEQIALTRAISRYLGLKKREFRRMKAVGGRVVESRGAEVAACLGLKKGWLGGFSWTRSKATEANGG